MNNIACEDSGYLRYCMYVCLYGWMDGCRLDNTWGRIKMLRVGKGRIPLPPLEDSTYMVAEADFCRNKSDTYIQ